MPSPSLRYAVAACQTDLANPLDRAAMRANTDRMLAMVDHAVAGAAPFLPVRLVVFPEFAHAAPVYATVGELLEKLAVPIPNEHTERLTAKAREHDIYIQSGTMIETDEAWPGIVFNATCLIGPEGMAAWPRLVATPGVVPHLYGKGAARPGRKMGHANRLIPLGRLAAMAEDEALHGL